VQNILVEKIYNIAGFLIRITFSECDNLYLANKMISSIQSHLCGFEVHGNKKTDAQIDFVHQESVLLMKTKKDNEVFVSFYKNYSSVEYKTTYYISHSQFEIILKFILLYLLDKEGGFMLHGSSSAMEEEAIVFIGDPGAGKSTIMNNLKENFRPLADDSVIIIKKNNKWNMYQTPFIEKESWIKKDKRCYPIKYIFQLMQAKYHKVKRLSDQSSGFDILKTQIISEKKYYLSNISFLREFLNDFLNVFLLYFPNVPKDNLIFINRINQAVSNAEI